MFLKPDEGWSWVVMLASFGAHIVSGCFLYAVGIIHIAILDRFQQDVTKTSWAGALFLCLFSSGVISMQYLLEAVGTQADFLGAVSTESYATDTEDSIPLGHIILILSTPVLYLTIIDQRPLAGAIVNRYSCRVCMIIGSLIMCAGFIASALLPTLDWIILSFGGVAGLGAGLTYSSHVMVIGFNFEKKRNIASGIAVSGCGVGTFTMAPVLQASREAYGDTGLFYICGGIALHHCVFGALFFPSYLEAHRKDLHAKLIQKSSRTPLSRSIAHYCNTLKNLPLISLCFSMFFANIGIYLLYVHFPEYVVTTGPSAMQASYLLSITGICNCISRVLSGMATNAHDVDETLIYFGTFGLLGLSSVFFPFYATSYPGQVAFAIFLGLYSGCCYSVLNTMVIQIAGIVNLATAFGLILFSTGIGTLIGPPLAGFIVENGGSYERSFFVAGLVILMGSVLGAVTVCSRPVATDHQPDSIEEKQEENEKQTLMIIDNIQNVKSFQNLSESNDVKIIVN